MSRTGALRCGALALIVGATGCGAAAIPEAREAAFTFAVERLDADDHARSTTAAWRYLRGAGPDDPRYDRAVRLLARNAEQLGLSYAASLWYLEIAEGQRDPTLVPDAVRGLQRIIEGGPHDAETLIAGFLATSELGGLPADLQAFVDYHRGVLDARQRLDAWADARLSRIDPRSPYHRRAAYVQAVRQVAARDLGNARAALEALEAVADAEPLPDDLDADVRRSLARLAMDAGDHAAAMQRYEALRRRAPDDPELLLEMAWAAWHTGDSRRALGLLLALDAPVYSELIAPERFLLEALSLRRLCQFGPARQAAVRLRERHGAALDDLERGVAPIASPALRAAARLRPGVRGLSDLVRRLEAEHARVQEISGLGDTVRARLETMYARGLAEARRRLEAALRPEVDAVAADLLAADEEVRLILHELGVALLRGRRRPPGPAEKTATEVASSDGRALFAFTGEFWTDELDDLVVVAEDRCIE